MAATPTRESLTASQQRRGLWVLGVSTFMTWGGFFMVIPLVSVHYVEHLGWAAGTVGLVLAVRQFTQQGMTTLFGVLSDRVGPKPLICIGMFIRAVGFAGLGWATTFWWVLLAMVVASIGGGLFDSPKAAATAALTTPANRQRIYSIFAVLGGLGVAVGTQTGALLIRSDFRLVCLVTASAYAVMCVVMLVLMPPVQVASGDNAGSFAALGMALRDRTFMAFMLLVSGFWFAWAQFALTMVLAATEITGTVSAVSWIYLVNTSITIGLGFLLPTVLGRWLRPIDLAALGLLVLGLGLAIVGFADSTAGILVAAAVFSIGVVICRPGHETITANLADPAARGTYFGVAYLSLAIGGGIGNLVGGVAYDVGKNHDMQALPWIIFGTVAAACAAGMWLNRGTFSVVRDDPNVTSGTA